MGFSNASVTVRHKRKGDVLPFVLQLYSVLSCHKKVITNIQSGVCNSQFSTFYSLTDRNEQTLMADEGFEENRDSVINKIPNEVLLKILKNCVEYEIEIEFDSPWGEEGHYNRYTAFAMIGRQVCRLWKEEIDLPSSYHFRTTVTHLRLRGDKGVLENHAEFQRRIANPKSMLMIGLIVELRYYQDFTLEGLLPSERENIRNFLLGVDSLASLQSRLVNLRVEIPPGEFEDYMFDSFQSLDHSAVRTFILMKDEMSSQKQPIGLREFMQRQPIVTRPDGLRAKKNMKRAPLLDHFSSLQFIRLHIKRLDIKLPSFSSLTRVEFSMGTNYYLEEVRAFLQPIALHLKHLEMTHLPPILERKVDDGPPDSDSDSESDGDIRNEGIREERAGEEAAQGESGKDEVENLTPCKISLPSLERLRFAADPVLATRLLLFHFDCPKLWNIYIETAWNGRGREIISGDIPTDVAQKVLPGVKTFATSLSGDQTLLPFEALSFPNLEYIWLNAAALETSAKFTSAAAKNRLASAPLHTLHLQGIGLDLLTEFLSTVNLENIRELCIWEHAQKRREDNVEMVKVFTLPNLQHLEVNGRGLKFIISVFSSIKTGKESMILSCRFDKPFSISFVGYSTYPNPIEVEGVQEWMGYLANRSNMIPQVYTLTVDGSPPDLPGFTKTLFTICPNTRRLVFRHIEPAGLNSYQPLSELFPEVTANGPWPIAQLLPKLEEIIMEFLPETSKEVAEKMIQGWLSETFRDIDTTRRKAGAARLKSITVRLFSEYEAPYVEEFPQKGGGTLRLEIVSAPIATGRPARYKTDSWVPSK
jgi:hypothetical protein